jgi:tetratricopeptide (TPR) repeat protein
MIYIPPPSHLVVESILEAMEFCRQGEHDKAAHLLNGAARISVVMPAIVTDIYHVANATIKLELESRITDEGLIHMIRIVRNWDLELYGPEVIAELYHDYKPRPSDDMNEMFDTRKWLEPLSQLDLDHFIPEYLTRMAMSLISYGSHAYNHRNLDEALVCFRNALRIAKYIENHQLIAIALFEVGFVVHSYQDTGFAEKHYFEALALREKLPSKEQGPLGYYAFRAGNFFEMAGEKTKAREFYEVAMNIFRMADDREGIKSCNRKLG